MTDEQLITMGFKKKKLDEYFWYELKVKGGHLFLTNDNSVTNNKWFVGYQNNKQGDYFWFNNKLHDEKVFTTVFHLLVGVDFKLAHQRNKIR